MNKPQVGISSMWYEGNPCNMHLLSFAEEVKKGVVSSRPQQQGQPGWPLLLPFLPRAVKPLFFPLYALYVCGTRAFVSRRHVRRFACITQVVVQQSRPLAC